MRIFTSLMFDEETKNKLSELQATIKERGLKAKILPPSSLHVTLVFLGEVPGERLSDISVALSFSALSLSLPLPLVVRPKRFRFSDILSSWSWKRKRVSWLTRPSRCELFEIRAFPSKTKGSSFLMSRCFEKRLPILACLRLRFRN